MTICVAPKRPLFVAAAVVDPVRSQLLRTARDERFVAIVYCFMPDHLHVLAAGASESSDLRRFVNVFKQVSAFDFKRASDRSLWEPGYWDRVLRDEESTLEVARYIVNNPVRKGLARSALDYPFSGSDMTALGDIIGDVQMIR